MLLHEINPSQHGFINKEEAIRSYKTRINDEICAEIIAHMNAVTGERFYGEGQVLAQLNESCLLA